MSVMSARAWPSEPATGFAPADAITSIVACLAEPRRTIENQFLAIGGNLGECVEIILQITTIFDGLNGTTAGADETTGSGRLQAQARRALALAGMATAGKGDANELGRLEQMVAKVRGPVRELEDVVRRIGLVALSTRINAAHLTGSHDDFAVFTIDISRLSDHVERTVKEFAQVYGTLAATLTAANDKQARFEVAHAQTMQHLVARLDASLADVTESQRAVDAGSVEMGASFRRIAAGIGRAVSALQIGDSTRQRVEHVEEALDALLNRLADAQADSSAMPAIVAAVCRLQSAQLTETRENFDRDLSQLVETLRALADEARTIVEQSSHIHGAAVLSNQKIAAELLGEIENACSLIRAGEATRVECERAASSVVSSLQDLMRCVEAVQVIEADMHIVSLNMGLKCARLGPQGNTLNVVAQELRALTSLTVGHAGKAIASLKTAATFAESLVSRQADDALDAVVSLERDTAAADGAQAALDAALATTLDGLARDGARAAALLKDAAANVMRDNTIGDVLRRASTMIDAIHASALAAYDDSSGESFAAAEAAAIADLSDRYTMASERRMHGRFAQGGTTGQDSGPASAPASEDDLDALFL